MEIIELKEGVIICQYKQNSSLNDDLFKNIFCVCFVYVLKVAGWGYNDLIILKLVHVFLETYREKGGEKAQGSYF